MLHLFRRPEMVFGWFFVVQKSYKMNIKSPNRKTNNFVRNLNKYFEGIKQMPRKLNLYTEAVTIFGCFVGG